MTLVGSNNTFNTTEDAIQWVVSSLPKPDNDDSDFESVFAVNDCQLAVLIGKTVPVFTDVDKELNRMSHFSFEELYGISPENSYISARVAWITPSKETQKIANVIARALISNYFLECRVDRITVTNEDNFGFRVLPISIHHKGGVIRPLSELKWRKIDLSKGACSTLS